MVKIGEDWDGLRTKNLKKFRLNFLNVIMLANLCKRCRSQDLHRLSTARESWHFPIMLCDYSVPIYIWPITTNNAINQSERVIKTQQAPSAGKHATGAKRGKTCNPTVPSAGDMQPVPSAGKYATSVKSQMLENAVLYPSRMMAAFQIIRLKSLFTFSQFWLWPASLSVPKY